MTPASRVGSGLMVKAAATCMNIPSSQAASAPNGNGRPASREAQNWKIWHHTQNIPADLDSTNTRQGISGATGLGFGPADCDLA